MDVTTELTVGTIELLIFAAGSYLFCITYLIFSRKALKTPVGRAVFFFVLSCALTLTAVFLATNMGFGPNYPFRAWIRILTFGFACCCLYNLWRVMVLLQVSPKYRARYDTKHPSEPVD